MAWWGLVFLCSWVLKMEMFSDTNWDGRRSKKRHVFCPEVGALGLLKARKGERAEKDRRKEGLTSNP